MFVGWLMKRCTTLWRKTGFYEYSMSPKEPHKLIPMRPDLAVQLACDLQMWIYSICHRAVLPTLQLTGSPLTMGKEVFLGHVCRNSLKPLEHLASTWIQSYMHGGIQNHKCKLKKRTGLKRVDHCLFWKIVLSDDTVRWGTEQVTI